MCCAASLQRGEWLLYYNVQADVIVNFHIGEVLMSLQKATLIPGGSESLVYTTLSGGIGMLVPFTAHEVCVYPAPDLWLEEPGLVCFNPVRFYRVTLYTHTPI